jgi:hypothetical protein
MTRKNRKIDPPRHGVSAEGERLPGAEFKVSVAMGGMGINPRWSHGVRLSKFNN